MTSFILQYMLLKVHIVIHRRLIIIFLLAFSLFVWFQLFFFSDLRLRLWWYYSLLCFAFVIWGRNYLSEVIVFDAKSRQLCHVVGC